MIPPEEMQVLGIHHLPPKNAIHCKVCRYYAYGGSVPMTAIKRNGIWHNPRCPTIRGGTTRGGQSR